jgi:hypothetical protein
MFVTVRDRVPERPHVPLKPPHADQAPTCVPQALPVVLRLQVDVSEYEELPHAPDEHDRVVTLRDCVPDSSQESE